MSKTVSAIVSGAAAAAIVGAAVYMMNGRNSRSIQKVKRNAAKTVRAMGSIVDGITEIVR